MVEVDGVGDRRFRLGVAVGLGESGQHGHAAAQLCLEALDFGIAPGDLARSVLVELLVLALQSDDVGDGHGVAAVKHAAQRVEQRLGSGVLRRAGRAVDRAGEFPCDRADGGFQLFAGEARISGAVISGLGHAWCSSKRSGVARAWARACFCSARCAALCAATARRSS